MDSGYIADVVVWERRIAAVIELARDGVCAMWTGWDIWSFRHDEHSEC
jgi:hypothetical protein